MENGSSKFRRPTKSYHKIYGSKENDSEIDFEEAKDSFDGEPKQRNLSRE
jgi:hypothetical protein